MTPAHSVRRTQAERTAETRRRVLDAAAALVASHGAHAVSLAAVGEAAGYSRGIVNHHFGSKEGLFDATVEAIIGGLGDAGSIGGGSLGGSDSET